MKNKKDFEFPRSPKKEKSSTKVTALITNHNVSIDESQHCLQNQEQGKGMAVAQTDYEKLRDEVIQKYKIVYKDSVAMDACKVPKNLRIRMLEDEVYIAETKAIKAYLFIDQLSELDAVIGGSYDTSEKGSDRSGTVLKCLELKQKLLLEDLNVTKDDSNALNVIYVGMNKADFEALETVEINEGSNVAELSADFGMSENTDSFEARMKAQVQTKMKELEEKKGEEQDGSDS